MKNKFLFIINALCFIAIGAGLLYLFLFYFPTNTEMHPQNYFNQDIYWTSSVPEFSGLIEFKLTGISMYPTIPQNASLLVAPNVNVSIGDIVAYHHIGIVIPIAHRLIGIKQINGQIEYLMKGDNVKYNDYEWVNQSQIIGRVVGVLYAFLSIK